MNISVFTDCSYSSLLCTPAGTMNPKPRSRVKTINNGHSGTNSTCTGRSMLTNCSYNDVVFPCWRLKNEKIKKNFICMENSDCITYQLPSTMREVSSFSCWLLNLDKVGRLLLILSGRNLENLRNIKFFIATHYFLSSGITRMLKVNNAELYGCD